MNLFEDSNKDKLRKDGCIMRKKNLSKNTARKGAEGKHRKNWDNAISRQDIDRICLGEWEPFGKVVKNYQRYALGQAGAYVDGLLGLHSLAHYEKDMVQDVWLKLREVLMKKFKDRENREWIESEFGVYVKKTINNLLKNELKKLAVILANEPRSPELDDIEDYPDPTTCPKPEGSGIDVRIWMTEIEIKDKRLAEVLKGGLDKLKDRHKEVLELAYVEDLTNEDIAKIMNLNKRSVDNYLSEAIRILRSCRKDDDK